MMSLCRVGLAGLARYGNPRLVNMATMRLTRKITSKPVTTGFTDRLTNTNPTYNTASSYHLPFITTNQFKTSVSEMTRKNAACRSPNCIRKQKIHSVECGYLSHYQNSVKNCFPTQNFTGIGQSATC